MTDIKMSDTFDLPVGSTEFTLVAMSKSTYISMDVAAVIAINSYDANQERIAELEKERIKLLSCLLDISNECIGEITMNYRVDSEYIGGRIQATTGMTRSQLGDAVKWNGND